MYFIWANFTFLSISLARLVPHQISSGLAYSEDAPSSFDAREGRSAPTVVCPGGVRASRNLNNDTLVDLCTSALYAKVSSNR